ncbi:BZ3500_MvSof-1268-A1-R1_Chr1-3g02298 [Microbotryum saponariae]|uniref:DNA replication complex GINS protein PSF3 n=1 Tax=Microbotryum saponariae TaxID=289078 RepID=A0A2X0MTN4_9BASI|nr:BZ3500_MvSof-1268-A1-R1_Chr1-3g02298 [Microbotryum saponariae]SCZ95914.1 BZ3501_MvSof-1269-A2-R1_Chr1-3g01901 [Microbotryum saponariae]
MASNEYYDVQDFLADAQKVSCRFESDVSNLGYLEGSTDQDIKAGTTLELPLWLALPIEGFASILLPSAYGTRTRNALAASANSVNLKNLGGGGGSFYAVGHKIGSIIEGDAIQKALDDSFRTRVKEVMDQSQHTSADSGGEGAAYEFCQGLDGWERQLFLLGEQSAKEMRAWFEVKGMKSSSGTSRR